MTPTPQRIDALACACICAVTGKVDIDIDTGKCINLCGFDIAMERTWL
jgi:hypothetical protein